MRLGNFLDSQVDSFIYVVRELHFDMQAGLVQY